VTKPPGDLSVLRAALDGVDAELVSLLAKRLSLVAEIGETKASGEAGIRDALRERDVLERVEAVARDLGVSVPLTRKIFGDIIAHSVTRQAAFLTGAPAGRVPKIAFQGVAHANSWLAAHKYLSGLGLEGELTGFRSFREAVDALASSRCDLAFLPIENTTAGSINQVYDLLLAYDVSIVGEETWKVDHCLAAPADVPLTSIAKILSHPQGLEQCSLFVQSLPGAQPVFRFDTAEALKEVSEAGDPTQAGIGPPEAAAAYGLVVLRRGIANQEENFTRFVALARSPEAFDPRIPCKTSLVLTTRHERGALLKCLAVLSDNGLSMTKLESRPRPQRPWEYMFFVDFEGNVADEKVARALEELKVEALWLKVLGSYPAKATPQDVAAPEVSAPVEAVGIPLAPAPEKVAAPAVKKSPHYRLVSRDARAEDTIVRVGDLLIGGDGFLVMAGPCSVESKAQIEATAKAVREAGARILRGGVFKPRTSPYAFQGLGEEGLDLLAAAGKAFGMPIVSEVLAPEQVRLMAAKADILQIGARNMQNFPLLNAVGKVDRPVLLKRGLSSTIEEWLAAAEYILAKGNGQVILCERGIRTFESATRNTLDLSAVVAIKERTHLPVIVDPSHGTGRRPYVAPMAWAARACGAHGLLIEVHPDPDRALSDGDQSLTFTDFRSLMDGLSAVAPPRAGRG
jgi:chorismate mutase/prephenate dehydratase